MKPTDEITDTGVQLLLLIGGRVKQARQNLGLSQARLAEISGVSLRYLAQIESGKGNISIVLLVKVATALGMAVQDLVATGAPSQAPAPVQKIALIGLRGAGKSTLGPLLAGELGFDFVELNSLIQSTSGLPVNEVFALYGQEGYRKLEFQAVQHLAMRPNPMVVAVAGGIVSESETYQLLRDNFRAIWLRADPKDHMMRVRNQGDERPMTGNPDAMSALKSILNRREARYAKADYQIDTSGYTVQETLRAALKILEKTQEIGD